MKNIFSPFLKIVRVKTDESLSTERGKSDETLKEAKSSAERRTDAIVEKSRATADQNTASARKGVDDQRDLDKHSQSSKNLLNAERSFEDSRVQQMRESMDVAMELERASKDKLVDELLSKERGVTDLNLKTERSHTDEEVLSTSTMLNSEIRAHGETKVSLTSRDEILAIVSHDLKNPVASIFTSAELLLENATPEQKELVEIIRRNAQSALNLIKDLLDIEKLAKGKFELKVEDTNIHDLVAHAEENFKVAAAQKNLKLELKPDEKNLEVKCDGDRVMQVLSNLIGNAIKFTPEGGEIFIEVDNKPADVEISITDTGPGIPTEKTKKIFERFAQLGSQDRSGLGLGLYISKVLAEAQHGRLWVESKVGKGSKFTFSIPKEL